MASFRWGVGSHCKWFALCEMSAIFQINYYVHLNNGVLMAHDDDAPAVGGVERESGALAFMWCAKSVIALHEMLTYNLERNLHVFTWLLHNLANLLVNVFAFAPQKDIWLSQRSTLFLMLGSTIRSLVKRISFFLFFAPRQLWFISKFSEQHWNCTYILGEWRIIKCMQIEGNHQKVEPKKCNEAKKRSFWQTMCSFLFIRISRIFHRHILLAPAIHPFSILWSCA